MAAFAGPCNEKSSPDDSDCFDSAMGNHQSSGAVKLYDERPLVTRSQFKGFPLPVECVIIVKEQQRPYADHVATVISTRGIFVDILIIQDEALVTQAIDDVARRGSLYAILIGPQNVLHHSITIIILHGTPEEHCNMLLADALKLLSRNFHHFIRSQREHVERERTERGQYIGVVADPELQFLLGMLADGRWISLSESNRVLSYLTDRRDKMMTDEVIYGRMDFTPADIEMQHSVNLNDSDEPALQIDPETVQKVMKSNDPDVKNAIDLLMLSGPNLLLNASVSTDQVSLP